MIGLTPILYYSCPMLYHLPMLILVAALAGCVSSPTKPIIKTHEKIYRANFEETWRAVQQSIMPYPLRVNNMDTGQIQTTLIKGANAFQPPHTDEAPSGGYRYRLHFNVLKLSEQRTKVAISKKAELARDFFSEPEEQGSDGLEEKILLYRIGREIAIERQLVKATLPNSK